VHTVVVSRQLRNEAEAREVLEDYEASWRERGYGDLRRLVDGVTKSYFGGLLQIRVGKVVDPAEATGPSGERYHLQADVFWDSGAADEDLRVWIELKEAAEPHGKLTTDFIMAPDGSFVDE
jgi:hypothetical protein